MDTTPREAALTFLKSHRAGVLATLSPAADAPRARLVYYACDDFFTIYFLTLVTTRKAADLRAHSQAAFVVAEEEVPQTLQLEGAVEDLTDRANAQDPGVLELFRAMSSNAKYYAPVARLDQADVRYYRLTPSWIRFGDFTQGRSTEEVLKEIAP